MLQNEYAKRRQALMRQIGPDALAILPAAPVALRNGDADYPYRQQSDFYYLTGFDEPEAVMVLLPKNKTGHYVLFNRERDAANEIWNGPRAGQKGAVKNFGVDEALPIKHFAKMLPEILAGKKAVYYPRGINESFDKILQASLNKLRGKMRDGLKPVALIDITPLVHELRVYKSTAEISLLQKAVDITGKGHIRAMQACKPGMYEYELEAEMMREFLRDGARACAYNSIVGAGRNTCILHYVQNNQKIKNGDLVLIDAGAEYQNYAADITRTFPANGKFSAEQRAIYELVLAAQLAAIKTLKPGVSWTKAQDKIVRIITEGLIELKILKGSLDQQLEKRAYLPFYMHRSGHWLGLDVHDAGAYQINGQWWKLEAGMALTVEPGIYISPTIKGVHKRWHNIGVRIEDDVIITAKGHRVLSEKIPKTIAEIESVMAK